MANPDPSPSHVRDHLREEELETANDQLLDDDDDEDDTDDDGFADTTDDDEDDDADEEDEEVEEEESLPRVSDSGRGSVGEGEKRRRVERGGESCWISGVESGDCSQGSQWNRSEIDGLFCPICMDAWTDNGDHHISCLPCGHIYGFSCIEKWFQQHRSSGKCPQCNRKCSLKDVRKLFASRVVAVDEESQKRIQFLEAKCADLEKKGASCDRCEKQAEWRKRETELDLKIQHLEKECSTLKSQTAEILTLVRRNFPLGSSNLPKS
ncbi:hypothetical protein LWI28_028806 [Acer negundo]|uniref:RING-type domain-containing protein n=1 Tax=Acer negundo TaxID=4023 RepID=A0AAD5NGH1_ACENE|nr:hypothetical protein LWI28_028806 [Acer negundo]